MKAPTSRVERGSVVATKAFKASSCTALKKLALPPTSKLVSPSMPRCSNSLCQPRIVSSFNKNAAATSSQLHPSSSSTKAFARRVRRDAADPSRANAIRCLRSSALRKPPRIMPHPNPPIRERHRVYLNNIPFADHGALLDPPTEDVTARCISMLAQLGAKPGSNTMLRAAIDYLRDARREDGSWYGRWGMNYIYGTWSVLCA